MRLAPSKDRVSAYGGSRLTPPGPGNIMVKFDYIVVKDASAKLSLSLNFNLEGKGNGSAGRATIAVPSSPKWSTFHAVYTVPDKTVGVQFVLGLVGAGSAQSSNERRAFDFRGVDVCRSRKVLNESPLVHKNLELLLLVRVLRDLFRAAGREDRRQNQY